ncbi:SAP18 family protein [Aspergillus novofumigatus IBT 16806]|uniref:Sin3-associated polypeptide Sap18 n=1 Tax=Aspergillus novofumigatus (strain IBT 16806) TaxID=1392255 RepID=A0A2I1C7M3_ASPN1|nr:uncharacterized protein P174DRAFT_450601 [Aspergillus novofumigatus IBT 16806]PKX93623.1 hypothetical protein P174DRAFT_450601 [Aspergillus novofumigatus IBT 16806]
MAARDAPKPQIDRQKTTPFHLKLFYRVDSFHPLSDFAIPSSPSSYNGPTSELTQLLTSALPSLLPDPAVGTRICFRLIYPDTKGAATMGGDARGRYLSKDMGSVVVGPKDSPYRGENDDENGASAASGPDFRFVIGDYVDCAILPPLEDGSVAPPLITGRGPASGPVGGA